jgi:4-amino-4-deoxychorismate lyase
MGRGVVPSGTGLVTADDLGLTRGDGYYDAARVVVSQGQARVDHLDRHLRRFAGACRALDLPDLDEAAWRALINEALAVWHDPGEAALKLVRTRGSEFSPDGPTELLTITTAPDASRARQGVRAITLSRGTASDAFAQAPWLLGGVKTLSHAVNSAAKREAHRRGVDEAIFVSTDGFLLETPTAGLIIAADDQLWTTPSAGTGILTSVTVAVVMDAARAEGVGARDALFRPEDLPGTSGLWLASSVRGILPVLELDGVALPHSPELTRHLARTAGF